MEKKTMLYEGKAKRVYETDHPEEYIVAYKDDATAFNGLKKGSIDGKGVVNNQMSNLMMQLLAQHGIPTHYIRELSQRETLVEKVTIIPLEVILRNRAAGSFSKRYSVEEGTVFSEPTLEFSYKNDTLGDPLINERQAMAIGLATRGEIDTIEALSFRINQIMSEFFEGIGIILVDFKLEFGHRLDGTIVLADEISPDTCRFWDSKTGEKLDKDRFRRDLGNVEEAYQEIMRRVSGQQTT